MSLQGIRFLTSIGKPQLAKPVAAPAKEFAQNFQTNFAKGELVPKVQNEVLANKLDVFA